ncbi:MAG: hypothetical protein NT062_17205, partial [Proteobacteria bacterium]|nr:hypothetical protein [Pseudomonadota bacterium]
MSRREVLRRRLAPAVFIIGMAFIVQHTCMKAERHHATIELDFGDAKASTRAVDAQLRSFGSAPEDEAIATFRRVALPDQGIGPCRFEVAMPDETAELV